MWKYVGHQIVIGARDTATIGGRAIPHLGHFPGYAQCSLKLRFFWGICMVLVLLFLVCYWSYINWSLDVYPEFLQLWHTFTTVWRQRAECFTLGNKGYWVLLCYNKIAQYQGRLFFGNMAECISRLHSLPHNGME